MTSFRGPVFSFVLGPKKTLSGSVCDDVSLYSTSVIYDCSKLQDHCAFTPTDVNSRWNWHRLFSIISFYTPKKKYSILLYYNFSRGFPCPNVFDTILYRFFARNLAQGQVLKVPYFWISFDHIRVLKVP